MAKEHHYRVQLTWTGNTGTGTSSYRAYLRDHEVSAEGRPAIPGSSDPAFRGDPARWNPEQLLLASLAQCHMLWYLHLATTAGVTVVAYRDEPTGTMVEEATGAGHFSEVTLRPRVTVADPAQVELAESLHGRVGEFCFIARSVNFPVHHRPATDATGTADSGTLHD
ncbi:OsmC family protein [Thermobifida halotolerans]|uniref:OsmC family protein n=1 Tax=Thermobifida halotolerans TaxID=483545 RepID=A0AA97LZU4_9ACTN|nr:OsmC family protein [Thermobifida halotolerans]UOE21200.1 OsmC family protein [Thermobifida halotolerans]